MGERSFIGTHPRLYFTPGERTTLRARREQGVRARMYANLVRSADWCLTRPVRRDWIAPVTPDPIYENLYDRFYAMMHDMAVVEHLAFAWSYSGDAQYLAAARGWTLACAQVWRREADGDADAAKAYAVLRLLKGIATAYDLIHEGLSAADRTLIVDMLAEVGGKYFRWYLADTSLGTAKGQGAHHASVEVASFGIASLALLGDVPEAGDWLDLMVDKHRALLRDALTPSGQCDEGATFWASVMQYRIAFMDALRRVAGVDQSGEFAAYMEGRLALASINGGSDGDVAKTNQSVLLSPSYGQLDYAAPVLVALARVYRRPLYQLLALRDRRLGALQRSHYITRGGEAMCFAWGGYAYAWFDDTLAPAVEPDAPRSFAFPEVGEAYLRDTYDEYALVAATKHGRLCVNIAGTGVLCETRDADDDSTPGFTLSDNGAQAVITTHDTPQQELILDRPGQLALTRCTTQPLVAWCHTLPQPQGSTLTWPGRGRLTVVEGDIASLDPRGRAERIVVGLGLLDLTPYDPDPQVYPTYSLSPTGAGRLVVRIQRDTNA